MFVCLIAHLWLLFMCIYIITIDGHSTTGDNVLVEWLASSRLCIPCLSGYSMKKETKVQLLILNTCKNAALIQARHHDITRKHRKFYHLNQ